MQGVILYFSTRPTFNSNGTFTISAGTPVWFNLANNQAVELRHPQPRTVANDAAGQLMAGFQTHNGRFVTQTMSIATNQWLWGVVPSAGLQSVTAALGGATVTMNTVAQGGNVASTNFAVGLTLELYLRVNKKLP